MDSLSRRSFLRKLALGSATALGGGIIRAGQIYEGSQPIQLRFNELLSRIVQQVEAAALCL